MCSRSLIQKKKKKKNFRKSKKKKKKFHRIKIFNFKSGSDTWEVKFIFRTLNDLEDRLELRWTKKYIISKANVQNI